MNKCWELCLCGCAVILSLSINHQPKFLLSRARGSVRVGGDSSAIAPLPRARGLCVRKRGHLPSVGQSGICFLSIDQSKEHEQFTPLFCFCLLTICKSKILCHHICLASLSNSSTSSPKSTPARLCFVDADSLVDCDDSSSMPPLITVPPRR